MMRNRESAQTQADRLTITEVTTSDKFVLLVGYVECRVSFAFYEHFIICSGDYGEWVFECTWQTVQNNKPVINTSESYMLGKIPTNIKKYDFDSGLCKEQLKEWYKEIKDDFDDETVTEEQIEELDDIIESFDSEDGYRMAARLDDLKEKFEHILGYDVDDEYQLYSYGKVVKCNLLCNLKMLDKIRDYFINDGKDINVTSI